MSKVTKTVAHPKLYLRVNGTLQHVKEGTEVTVTAEQAESLGAKLTGGESKKKVDVSENKTKSTKPTKSKEA
jgi:hypothetical protein